MTAYRFYQSGDEIQIVRLWNETLWKDPITSKRFRNLVLLDANFDPEGMRLAFKDDKLIGCVYAVRRLLPMFGTDLEPDNGWIPFFFVDKNYQKSGVGAQLMKEATDFLKENTRKHVFFSSYAPNYIMPGIDEDAYPEAYQFLLAQGFKKLYSPIAMDRNLVDFKLSEEIKELVKLREDRRLFFFTGRG